ncbi:MAG: hypothetical protein GY867_04705 [bacterium]|nr:hypothetical protein [bacterium]
MKIPTTLKHKPVITVPNYPSVDGRYANNTDAKGLSLGLAQWNERGQVDVSAKIWRHTGERWSRQSEELPLHRVLDLAILVCRSKAYFREAYRMDNLYDPGNSQIDRIPLQGDAMTIEVCRDNQMLENDIQLFVQSQARDDELISERLVALSRILRDMGYSGA